MSRLPEKRNLIIEHIPPPPRWGAPVRRTLFPLQALILAAGPVGSNAHHQAGLLPDLWGWPPIRQQLYCFWIHELL